MTTLTDFCRQLAEVVADLRLMGKRHPGRAALLYQWAAHLDDDRRTLLLLAQATDVETEAPPLLMQPLNVTPRARASDLD